MQYKPYNILYNPYHDTCSPFNMITSALLYSFKRLSFAMGWLWHSEVKFLPGCWTIEIPEYLFWKAFCHFSFHNMSHMLVLTTPWLPVLYHWYTHTHTLDWKLIFRPVQCQGLLSSGEANLICVLFVETFYHSTPATIRELSGLCAAALKWVNEDGNWWYVVQSFYSRGKAILLAWQ